MVVNVVYGDEIFQVKEPETVEEAIEGADVNPETVIVEMEGKVVSLEERIEGDEEIKLINVVSGG